MTLVLFFKLSMIQSFWFPICALSLLPCITQSTETWLCLRSPSFSHSMWCVKRTPPSCPIPTASLSHLDSIGSYPLTAVSSFTVLLCTKWVCSTSLLLNHQMKPCTRKMRLQILFSGKWRVSWEKVSTTVISEKENPSLSFFFFFFLGWLHNKHQRHKYKVGTKQEGHTDGQPAQYTNNRLYYLFMYLFLFLLVLSFYLFPFIYSKAVL